MLTVFIRALILYVALIVVIRVMGKRQLGQLQPFELVLALLLADLDNTLVPYGVPGPTAEVRAWKEALAAAGVVAAVAAQAAVSAATAAARAAILPYTRYPALP